MILIEKKETKKPTSPPSLNSLRSGLLLGKLWLLRSRLLNLRLLIGREVNHALCLRLVSDRLDQVLLRCAVFDL
jgi:hypothetical protein